MKRSYKNIALLILLIAVMFLIFRNPLFSTPEVKELSMNEFMAKIDNNEISTAEPMTIKGDDKLIEGKLSDGTSFKFSYLGNYNLTEILLEKNIPFIINNQKQSIWIQLKL